MKSISKSIENTSDNNLVRILKGSALSILFTIVSLIVFALILAYTDTPETAITPVVISLAGVCILLGGIISSIKARKRGLLNGSLVGLLYVVVIYFLSSIIDNDFSLNTNSFIMIFICLITGALGGVIGINLKRKK